jgi:glutamine synthetase
MQNIVNTLRSEMADKQREIENAREELQRLGDQVYTQKCVTYRIDTLDLHADR